MRNMVSPYLSLRGKRTAGNESPELTEAQRGELNRRIDSYHAGSFRGRSWEDIKNDYWKSEQT